MAETIQFQEFLRIIKRAAEKNPRKITVTHVTYGTNSDSIIVHSFDNVLIGSIGSVLSQVGAHLTCWINSYSTGVITTREYNGEVMIPRSSWLELKELAKETR